MKNPVDVREPIDDWLQLELNLDNKNPHQGSSVAPLSTKSPLALWDSTVCWFRYPSCIKYFIKEFSENEMAGNPTPAPSSGTLSAPGSAIKYSMCYLDCIERNHPWHTFAVSEVDMISLRSDGRMQFICTSSSASRDWILPSRSNRL